MIALIDNIKLSIKQEKLDYIQISQEEAQTKFEILKKNFNFNYHKLHLWDDVYHHKTICSYQEKWASKLIQKLTPFDSKIYLVVTDDNYHPWQVFFGKKDEIKTLLEEQTFFEYFIFDAFCDKILFDTHHNAFILLEKKNN